MTISISNSNQTALPKTAYDAQTKFEPLPAIALSFPSKINNTVQGVQGPKYSYALPLQPDFSHDPEKTIDEVV